MFIYYRKNDLFLVHRLASTTNKFGLDHRHIWSVDDVPTQVALATNNV